MRIDFITEHTKPNPYGRFIPMFRNPLSSYPIRYQSCRRRQNPAALLAVPYVIALTRLVPDTPDWNDAVLDGKTEQTLRKTESWRFECQKWN